MRTTAHQKVNDIANHNLDKTLTETLLELGLK